MSEQQGLHHVLPFGICYLKAIRSDQHEIIDYLIIDQNTKFETLLSLQHGNFFQEPISKAWNNSAYWLYRQVLSFSHERANGSFRFEQLSLALDIHVCEGDVLALLLQKIPAMQPVVLHADLTDGELMFQHTHDAISIVAYDQCEFRYVRNNATHQIRSGIQDIQGLTPLELLGPETGNTLIQYYRQCIATGMPVTYEQTFAFSVGERVWQTEVIPFHHKDDIHYLLCVSKDITELKKTQAEKEKLMQRLQTMFRQHSAIMMLVDSASLHIVDANPAACQFYGYSFSEFTNMSMSDIDPQSTHLKPYLKENFEATVMHHLKNGSTKLVDVYSSPIDHDQLFYFIIFDVTAREEYRNALLQEKELLRTTLCSIGDGVVTIDNHGSITSLNKMAQKLTGWDQDAIGRPFSEVFHIVDDHAVLSYPHLHDHAGKLGSSFCILKSRHGSFYPITDHASLITTEEGKTLGVVIVFRDLSKERESAQKIRYLSQYDTLTNLYHRHYIEAQFPILEERTHLPLSVIIADVNGLKITNDIFGHEAGDNALKQVASLITRQCRKHDLIARWGGDEFMILLPQTSDADAEKIMERIKTESAMVEDSKLRLSLSLGCATKATADKTIQDAIKEAEEIMYHQKLLDEKSYRNTMITMLLATLYEKSNETEEHSKRMERHCHWIGQSLQLSSKQLDELSLLAILHDIGKVGINPAILKKPAPLTPFEWQEMQLHPEIGYRIVQSAAELQPIASFILAHHERWDGTGYPNRLAKEEIPLVCRILAVTDAYDAMTNDRSYRTALSHEQAVAELKRHAGTQFDPAIVELYISLLSADTSIYAV